MIDESLDGLFSELHLGWPDDAKDERAFRHMMLLAVPDDHHFHRPLDQQPMVGHYQWPVTCRRNYLLPPAVISTIFDAITNLSYTQIRQIMAAKAWNAVIPCDVEGYRWPEFTLRVEMRTHPFYFIAILQTMEVDTAYCCDVVLEGGEVILRAAYQHNA